MSKTKGSFSKGALFSRVIIRAEHICSARNVTATSEQIIRLAEVDCEIDRLALVEKAEKKLKCPKARFKIALMGCVVNGLGEAAADIGIAGGKGTGMLFKRGQIVLKLKEEEFIPVLPAENEKRTGETIG